MKSIKMGCKLYFQVKFLNDLNPFMFLMFKIIELRLLCAFCGSFVAFV